MKRKLVFLLYRSALIAGIPLLPVYALLRAARDKRYLGTIIERLGFGPPGNTASPGGGIWIHAVSVGEVIAAAALIDKTRARLSGVPVYLSVTTLAGRAVAEDRLAAQVCAIFYAPIDFAWIVRRVLRRLRPALVVVLETEIWPNLWNEAKRSGAGLVVVNGRISDRAWPRYRALRWLFTPVVTLADRILAQSEVSRERFVVLGARAASVEYAGNLKYDFAPRVAPEAVTRLMDRLQPSHVWIAASTMPPAFRGDCDENDAVLDAFSELAARFHGLLLILVPRKPEQFDDVASRAERRGLMFIRRSALEKESAAEEPRLPAVLLLDSMGELSSLFPLATAVLMGGTLARHGGHNILEPAFSNKAVVTGPHMENFAEIAAEFHSAGAVVRIDSAAGLTAATASLLTDSSYREAIGARAGALARARSGAASKAAAECIELLEQALPRKSRDAVTSLALEGLSQVWNIGGRWKRNRDLQKQRRLPIPVVSIGGIAMGGVGKTPFTIWMATELRKRGIRAAILTRGYRRKDTGRITIAAPEAELPIEVTGDEAQILIRTAGSPVGIGGDRFAAGLALLKKFDVDLFLLDDGFQHARLARDFDIALLDSLDPFSGGGLFPEGRLRESPSALGRASAIVLTRAASSRTYSGLLDAVRRWNASAPVFRSRVQPAGWRPHEPASLKGAAFCGLGNPDSFWSTLSDLGLSPLLRRSFRDHHQYTQRDLDELGWAARLTGAESLWTTEKDFVNLPSGGAAGLPVLELAIRTEVDEAELLLDLVSQRLFARPMN